MAERTAAGAVDKRLPGPGWSRIALYSGGALTAAGIAAAGVLLGQVEIARRTIPIAEAPPPRADGFYGHGRKADALKLVVLGDSSAAGFGVKRARQTPGALIAAGLHRRLE